MFLLSKNKIISYIKAHPESRVALLLWLKSFESKPESIFSREESADYSSSNGKGWASADEKYCIEFEINYPAKAELITWIGTNAEQKEKMEKEHAEAVRYYREVVGETLGSETLVLSGHRSKIEEKTPEHLKQTYNSPLNDKIANLKLTIKPSALNNFESFDEYESGLKEAISLFNARPDTPEFRALMILLLKIDDYERNELIFPEATLVEFVKARINFFQMNRSFFTDILSENDFACFLSGESELKVYTRNRVLTRLGLHSLVEKTRKN